MANYNKVILIGRLTKDIELRYTPKGTAVANIDIAVNRTWKNEAGETKEEATFISVDVFGRTAENCAQYVRKGSSIMCDGRLRLETWTDKTTQKPHSKLGVVAETIQFLDSKGGSQSAPRSSSPESKPSESKEKETDDVPF